MGAYDYNDTDREGFKALVSTSFTRFGDMIFRKSQSDPDKISERLRTEDRETVQRQINHTHLILYAADVETQRAWAQELRDAWLTRLKAECPDLVPEVEIEDTGEDVTVTALGSREMMGPTRGAPGGSGLSLSLTALRWGAGCFQRCKGAWMKSMPQLGG